MHRENRSWIAIEFAFNSYLGSKIIMKTMSNILNINTHSAAAGTTTDDDDDDDDEKYNSNRDGDKWTLEKVFQNNFTKTPKYYTSWYRPVFNPMSIHTKYSKNGTWCPLA